MDEPGQGVSEVSVDPVGRPFLTAALVVPSASHTKRPGLPALRGRRLTVESPDRSGLYISSRRPRGPLRDLAIDATLRAAMMRRGTQDPVAGEALIGPGDLREKVRVRRAGTALAFVVDASGSMRRNQRMAHTKAAILSLLMNAYTARDRVAMVAFRGVSAEVILPFTSSVEVAQTWLARLPAGGKTPLGEGLRLGLELTARETRRTPQVTPMMIVVSDGKPNWSRIGDPVREAEQLAWRIRQAGLSFLFVDTDQTWHEPGIGQTLTRITRGRYIPVDTLAADGLLEAVEWARSAAPQ